MSRDDAHSAVMDIPLLLGTAMSRKGMNQDALAREFGMTQGGVQKWLAAERRPGPEHWDMIAAYCGVDRETVDGAWSATKLVRPATLRVRLEECQEENVRLRLEIEALKARSPGER